MNQWLKTPQGDLMEVMKLVKFEEYIVYLLSSKRWSLHNIQRMFPYVIFSNCGIKHWIFIDEIYWTVHYKIDSYSVIIDKDIRKCKNSIIKKIFVLISILHVGFFFFSYHKPTETGTCPSRYSKYTLRLINFQI